jgi:predicted lactoylglutathione lyase
MRSTFIGLPTSDVAKATAFCTELGFTVNPAASDERTACITIDGTTSLMLSSNEWFTEFTGTAVTDPRKASEVSLGFSAASREEVDELTERAVAAGAEDQGPVDLGYMYMRAFRDLDGHRWTFMHFAQM